MLNEEFGKWEVGSGEGEVFSTSYLTISCFLEI